MSVWCGSTWYCRLTRGVKYQVASKIRWVTGCLIRSRLLDCGVHGDIGSGVVIVLRLRVDWGVYGLLSWVRGQVAAGCTCLIACLVMRRTGAGFDCGNIWRYRGSLMSVKILIPLLSA